MDNKKNNLGIIDSYKLKETLSFIPNIAFANVPQKFKDGGEMDARSIKTFCKEII